MPHSRTARPWLSRRQILKSAGAAGAAALAAPALAACGGRDPAERSGAGLTIVTPTATAQTEDHLNHWLGKFTEQTGIHVTARYYPNGQQYNNALGLLFQGNERPDVFRMVQGGNEMPAAYRNGWIQPLDSYDSITGVLEEEYPSDASDPVLSGLHIGKRQYGMPGMVHRPWGATRALMCNMDILEQHGIQEIPRTWGELRAAARKISQDSGRDIAGYGLVGGVPDAIGAAVYGLQNVAGPQLTDPGGTPLNFRTGRPDAAHDSLVSSITFLRSLVRDKSVPRGWEAMQPPQFFQQFASGKIGMAVISSWWWAEIHKLNPDIPLGFGPTPLPDSGRKGYVAIGSIRNPGRYQPYWGMSKGSRHAEDAARLIAFLAGVPPQRDFYRTNSLVTALADKYPDQLVEQDRKLLQLAEETQRTMPNPLSRSDGAIDVLAALSQRSPKPVLGDIFLNALRGKSDYRKAAQSFDAELDKILEQELKKARDAGADIDRDTFTFPDWDPMQNYTA